MDPNDATNATSPSFDKLIRFPTNTMTGPQASALHQAEHVVTQTFGSSFSLKDGAGNLSGPFGPLVFTPSTPDLNHAQAVTTDNVIDTKEREFCVLATASVTKSRYIAYAH